MGLSKRKSFPTAKSIISSAKRQPAEWKKVCVGWILGSKYGIQTVPYRKNKVVSNAHMAKEMAQQ